MKMQVWGVKTIAGLGMFAGWFLACAGDDTPPVDDQLRGALVEGFGGAGMPVGAAGSAGSGAGGRGGSGSGNAGRAGSGTSGSANAGSTNSGGGAAGDGGDPVGGGGSGSAGPPCDAFNTILRDRCGTVGCHGAGSRQGDFGVSEEVAAGFVDEPSTLCDSLVINSANPEESLLYTKLLEASPDGCGNLQMPLSGELLTDDESACVLSWLQQFAE